MKDRTKMTPAVKIQKYGLNSLHVEVTNDSNDQDNNDCGGTITIYLCYDEYKNGKMSSKNFKIAAVCEGLAIDNPAITLFLKHGFVEEY